jgi:predicted HicB family RNase H-like nuclease
MMESQAMTIRVPGDLYEQLRRAAFEARVPMNALINEGIELRLAELKAAAASENGSGAK